jgi:hypothetical protein
MYCFAQERCTGAGLPVAMYVQLSNKPIHVSRFCCFFCLSLFCCFLSGTKSVAQCIPPPAYNTRLQQLDTEASGFFLYDERGQIYLALRCFDEARTSFETASANAENEKGDAKKNLKALAQKLLDLTSGYEALSAGRIAEAKTLLLKSSDEALPPEISVQASLSLAELLIQSPDEAVWSVLEPNLRRLDESGSWQARRYLLIYGLTAQNATERITWIADSLADDTPVQTRLEDEIILAELLRLAGRVREAQLLAANIEHDVGRKAISPDLRAQYIRVCAGITSVLARNGDETSRARYQVYLSALGQIYEAK